jgi:hypothetical protein
MSAVLGKYGDNYVNGDPMVSRRLLLFVYIVLVCIEVFQNLKLVVNATPQQDDGPLHPYSFTL